MASFRVETEADAASGLIAATLYYPETATRPLARTAAIYETHEAAETGVLEQFRKSLPE